MHSFSKDGFTLRVFSSMYVDWGLEITGPRGDTLYYNPSALSSEYCGFNEDEDDPEGERTPWTDEEWEDFLSSEIDDALDAYVDMDTLEDGRIYWVCTDCFLSHCNGDSTGSDDRDAEISDGFKAVEVSGYLAACGPLPYEQDDADTKEFCRESCDTCRSPLSGSRHRMVFIEE